ncbi:GNAT family N-acetyltransferase [Corynebacterium urinipleomorphum]|uniref:GNAT family N-acetyltransferase n=1 Tax=Corynebacterium urinipleomorphum TaxID=1852380 RepID=UPI000B35D28A|nr:GNAT family N-acetyltransferase [Corynebacterium urinipleomorphum]
MSVTIRELSPHEFSALAPTLVDLYIKAMHYPVTIREQRVNIWRRDSTERDFTSVAAFDGDELAGIAYGFRGSPGRWWDQQLRRGLADNHAMTEHMLEVVDNYFELAEIHVSPQRQGSGIGRTLIHRLLQRAPQRHVLLSTPEVPQESNAAFGLYRSLGFEDVLRNFQYAGDPRPFAVLGRTLPL